MISDAQIVAIVEAANGGELDQAHEAVRKAKNTRVKQFAQHMLTDHTAAGTKLTGVESKGSISPQESPTSTQLKSGGAQVMSDLKSAKGASFDTTYIDAQVKEHNGLLDLLDNKLIPQAQNADLRAMLQDVRKTVAAHLKTAQDIQSTLTK
jgi:putative membrane protein